MFIYKLSCYYCLLNSAEYPTFSLCYTQIMTILPTIVILLTDTYFHIRATFI